MFAEHMRRDILEGPLLNQRYVENLSRQVILINGALNALSQLKKHYEIVVITNDLSLVQRERLKRSGFLPLLNGVFISQEMEVKNLKTMWWIRWVIMTERSTL